MAPNIPTYTDYIYIIMICEAIGTAATPGLLCQPQVIVKMSVGKQMECRLAGETEVLGENLPQCHFCPSQNPTRPDPGLNLGRHGGKPPTNRLSYGAANIYRLALCWNVRIYLMKEVYSRLYDDFCHEDFSSRFPSLHKLQRVVAYCSMFIRSTNPGPSHLLILNSQ
jgi:hypothetical protein